MEGVKLTEVFNNEIQALIRRALAEDIGSGDITTDSIIPQGATMRGRIIAKQNGVIAGLDVARAVFETVEPSTQFSPHAEEGSRVVPAHILVTVAGPARALLTAERTALNFLGRMSGIATLTREFVDAVAGTKAAILDTRKTAPGLRMLDKLAVRRGGGKNHRHGLYDMILIKDNHIDYAGGLRQAVKRARLVEGQFEIEVEVRTLDDLRLALDLGVTRILLDNMTIDMLSEAATIAAGQASLEASGNVSLENVRQIAQTGVDYISIGALTHSAKNLDVSFDYMR